MLVVFPGADGSTVTIADQKSGASETIVLKSVRSAPIAVPPRRAAPAFMFNTFLA